MRSCRSSGSVEGVVSNHDPYSDFQSGIGVIERRADDATHHPLALLSRGAESSPRQRFRPVYTFSGTTQGFRYVRFRY